MNNTFELFENYGLYEHWVSKTLYARPIIMSPIHLATNFTRLPVHGNDPWMLSMRPMVEELRNAGSKQLDCFALTVFV